MQTSIARGTDAEDALDAGRIIRETRVGRSLPRLILSGGNCCVGNRRATSTIGQREINHEGKCRQWARITTAPTGEITAYAFNAPLPP